MLQVCPTNWGHHSCALYEHLLQSVTVRCTPMSNQQILSFFNCWLFHCGERVHRSLFSDLNLQKGIKVDTCYRSVHQCQKVQQLDRNHDGRKVAKGPMTQVLLLFLKTAFPFLCLISLLFIRLIFILFVSVNVCFLSILCSFLLKETLRILEKCLKQLKQ